MGTLMRHRVLLWEMSKLDLRDRYVGQALGLFWAFLMPLLTIGVYLFIFAFVFKAKMPEAVDTMSTGWGGGYTFYLLSGLIPWTSMQEFMTRSSTAIHANASLVKQMAFPLEVLPLKGFYTTIINQAVALTVFVLYGWICYGPPSPLIITLPLVIAVQLIAAGGIALIFSAVGAYLRDMREIATALCFVLSYVMPVFFVPSMLPGGIYTLIKLNPFTHLIVMYHDAVYYGVITSPESWVVFPVFSLLIWMLGCRVFTALKPMFGNVL